MTNTSVLNGGYRSHRHLGGVIKGFASDDRKDLMQEVMLAYGKRFRRFVARLKRALHLAASFGGQSSIT
jgi:hypothetical protein